MRPFRMLRALDWCLIICICSKIKLCIALTKTAGRAVRDVPLVVLFPIVQVIGVVACDFVGLKNRALCCIFFYPGMLLFRVW